MNATRYLQTGQISCHDAAGNGIPCAGSGQDGESRQGVPWPEPRFVTAGETVTDQLTGLVWCRDASIAEFPLAWQESLDYVRQMNRDRILNHDDWRLPNRHELRSLISHQARRPALPEDQPFVNVFNGWYWTSTTAAISPAHAWYVSLDGGRMFYGGKDQSFMLWPVRGRGNGILTATGQTHCYSATGRVIACAATGQDAEYTTGCGWPVPRFAASADEVIDRLTNLCWRRLAGLEDTVTWPQALARVARMNEPAASPHDWRLPNINELESLVDCGQHSPALPAGHPFTSLQDVYWSSSTSLYEPDWAWTLYLEKGAVGVGQKAFAKFAVWAVRNR